MNSLPQFSYKFLYPKYWLIWFGISLLYLLVLLPYPILFIIGSNLGRVAMYTMKRRVKIAKRNIENCFPNMPSNDQKKMLKHHFKSVGMGLIETGMAWFWPEWRIKKWFTIKGLENIQLAHNKKRGILLIGIHFLTLEIGARIFGIINPGIGVYRPNNNKMINWIQTWGRMRSNKNMLDRKNLKGIIRALKNKETIWYAPDHDYGLRNSVFVPFFAVKNAATTIGSYILIRSSKPAIIPFIPRRLPEVQGYELLILPDVSNEIPFNNSSETATKINKIIEKLILIAPDQYMWLHRRFKTRPKGEPSCYSE